MAWYTAIYIHYATRTFVPLIVFMTPFLIENKKFTNKEVVNRITPYFFVASLFSSLFGPLLVELIGNRNTLLFETGVEMVTFLILHAMPDRDFTLGILAGIVHGATTSITSLAKGALYDIVPEGEDRSSAYRDYLTIKKTMSVISSWVGQDMKFATGTYQAGLYLSLIMLFISLIAASFVPERGSKSDGPKRGFLKFFTPDRDLTKRLKNIYTHDIILFSLLSVIASTLYICFTMYSANIFIERKRSVDVRVNILGRFLYRISYPFRKLSHAIIVLLSLYDSSIIYDPKYDKNALIFGYIDGIAKLAGLIMAHVVVKRSLYESHLTVCAFTATAVLMGLTYLLGYAKSLFLSYLIYILGSSASLTCLSLTQSGLNHKKEVIHIISGVNLSLGSIIHIFISYIGKRWGFSANKKLICYFWVDSILLAIGFVFALFRKKSAKIE